jgi:hypothetical protein
VWRPGCLGVRVPHDGRASWGPRPPGARRPILLALEAAHPAACRAPCTRVGPSPRRPPARRRTCPTAAGPLFLPCLRLQGEASAPPSRAPPIKEPLCLLSHENRAPPPAIASVVRRSPLRSLLQSLNPSNPFPRTLWSSSNHLLPRIPPHLAEIRPAVATPPRRRRRCRRSWRTSPTNPPPPIDKW